MSHVTHAHPYNATPSADPTASSQSAAAHEFANEGESIRVACCQASLRIGDAAANRRTLSQGIARAAQAGARIVVLPELSNSGYVLADASEARRLAEPLDGPTVAVWSKLATEHGIVIVGGLCELNDGGEVTNTAVLLDHAADPVAYRKVHLWDKEKLLFTPGSERPPVVSTAFGRIGVVICYDLKFPEWVRLAALAGADLLCAPANWARAPRPPGERPGSVIRVQAQAAMNRIFIAVCDRVGTERGVEWEGASVIVDPDGWPLASATQTGEIVVADCQLSVARRKRISEHNDVHADRRPALYRDIVRM